MADRTDMQSVLQDAMRVIAESADEIKAGCAFDDQWPEAEDKAEHDRRVALLDRVRVLSGQSAGAPEIVGELVEIGTDGSGLGDLRIMVGNREVTVAGLSGEETRALACVLFQRVTLKLCIVGCSGSASDCPNNDGHGCACSAAPEPVSATAEQPMTDATRDVLAERHRVVEQEGFTPEHDDDHDEFDMALAAIVYAESAVGYHTECPDTWPWSSAWFKPTTPRRDLVKAAQLIIAEIERIDRAAIKPKQQ